MSLETWRTASLTTMAVGQTLFVLFYLLAFPWYKEFLGKALFTKATVLAVLLDTYVVYRIFPFPNADQVFVCLYVLLAFGIWGQLGAFVTVWADSRHRRRQRRKSVSGNGRGA